MKGESPKTPYGVVIISHELTQRQARSEEASSLSSMPRYFRDLSSFWSFWATEEPNNPPVYSTWKASTKKLPAWSGFVFGVWKYAKNRLLVSNNKNSKDPTSLCGDLSRSIGQRASLWLANNGVYDRPEKRYIHYKTQLLNALTHKAQTTLTGYCRGFIVLINRSLVIIIKILYATGVKEGTRQKPSWIS